MARNHRRLNVKAGSATRLDGAVTFTDEPTRTEYSADAVEVIMPCCHRARRFPAYTAENWQRRVACRCGKRWRVSRAKDGRFLFGKVA